MLFNTTFEWAIFITIMFAIFSVSIFFEYSNYKKIMTKEPQGINGTILLQYKKSKDDNTSKENSLKKEGKSSKNSYFVLKVKAEIGRAHV